MLSEKTIIGRLAFSSQLLNCLRSKKRATLDECFKLVHFKNGEEIYSQGNSTAGVYYIKSGKVKSILRGEDGVKRVTRIAGEGDFLGYKDLLMGKKYDHTMEACDEVSAYCIPHQVFTFTVTNDPKASWMLTQMACQELLEMETNLMGFHYKPVRGRVAYALLWLDHCFNNGASLAEKIAITRVELANTIGATQETVVRILSKFKNEQLISVYRGGINILDKKGLQHVTEEY